MRKPIWQTLTCSDTAVLALFGLGVVLLHILVNGQYGFHRDELLTYSNARQLAWGYVSYPPMTPFLARVELLLFGTSLTGYRFFAALSQGVLLFLTGLMARELGGKREAQLVAACAVAGGGYSLFSGSFHSYSTFDYLWWVLAAYFVVRLLKRDDARWWMAIGAAIGMGMLTKYTMAFLVLGIVGGMLLTPARRHLASLWFWGGVCVALLIMSPNIAWQIQHHFITWDCMRTIHVRDMHRGWTDGFLLNQLWKSSGAVTVPIWCAGLWFLFATPQGKRYRMLGWMYVIPLAVFLIAKGRDYYMAPAYPMLLAAGAVWGEAWLATLSARAALHVRRSTWQTLAWAGAITAAINLPVAPVNSAWWHIADGMNGNFNMEIGWRELAETVAGIRASLPAEDRGGLGIITGDDGETGAMDLYGPAYGLPRPISGMNSSWARGYGDPAPQTVITVGMERDFLFRNFESCQLAGRATNRYGIGNLAIVGYEDIFVCRHLRQPWPEFWKHFQYFG
jgi:4-amino-4-deoxy-L-arabinose transferase-like glycosyltransferase